MTIDKLIEVFISKGTEFYPVANSIKFHSTDDTNKNYLWIEPPWRIIKEKRVITSSFTCPWHGDFKTKEEYHKAFTAWSEKMTYLNNTKIKRHSIGQTVNDLIIEWTDGTILEVFQKDQENEAWYITDNEGNKYHLAFPDKIQIKEKN